MTPKRLILFLFCIFFLQTGLSATANNIEVLSDSIQKLSPSDHFGVGGDLSHFGYSVDIDSGLAVVGAPEAMGHGLALVYNLSGTKWELLDILFPEDGKEGDEFGTSVSINQGRIVVGAIEVQVGFQRAGAAYVFIPSGIPDQWEQIQKLVASDISGNDEFGSSIVQNSQQIIISAPRHSLNGTRGQIYVFESVNDVWKEQQLIFGYDYFGSHIALGDSHLIISAHTASVNQLNSAGRVYVYEAVNGDWIFEQVLQASDPEEKNFFGSSIDIEGEWLTVGADKDGSYYDGEGSGFVYVFNYDNNGWTETQKLTAPGDIHFNRFGASVQIDNNKILVSSTSDETTASYNGYVDEFKLTGEQWLHTMEFGPFTGSTDNQFGFELALDQGELIIASFGDDSIDRNAGSFFSYSEVNGVWQVNTKVNMPEGSARNYFGTSLDLQGDRLLIGSYGDDTESREAGSVYDYRLSEGKWVENSKLYAETPSAFEYFGYSVVMDQSRAVIGAPPFAGTDVLDPGSVYVFDLIDNAWVFDSKLVPSNGQDDDFFGVSVAVKGDYILVGATGNDDFGDRSGTVYVFQKINGIWTELTDLQIWGQNEDDYLGIDVALNDRWVVVAQLGSVFIFDRNTSWKDFQRIDGLEYFGRSIDLDENQLIIGSPDFNGGNAAIYRFNEIKWEQEQMLYPRGGAVRNWGESVALSGNNAVVGSGLSFVNGEYAAGAANWFSKEDKGWKEIKRLIINGGKRYDSFGGVISLYGEQVALSAVGVDDFGTNSGAVFMHKVADLIFSNGFELN